MFDDETQDREFKSWCARALWEHNSGSSFTKSVKKEDEQWVMNAFTESKMEDIPPEKGSFIYPFHLLDVEMIDIVDPSEEKSLNHSMERLTKEEESEEEEEEEQEEGELSFLSSIIIIKEVEEDSGSEDEKPQKGGSATNSLLNVGYINRVIIYSFH